MSNKEQQKVKFKIKIPFECGFLAPIQSLKNEFKSYCFLHNLNCEILESGFLNKHIIILISGEDTLEKANEYKSKLYNYMLRIADTINI